MVLCIQISVDVIACLPSVPQRNFANFSDSGKTASLRLIIDARWLSVLQAPLQGAKIMLKLRRLIDVVRYQANRRLNIDVVRASGQYTLTTHVSRVIEEYAVDAILDVGASEGDFGFLMRSIGFRGELYSFEPVSKPFEKLTAKSAKDPRWHVYNFALGSEAGESLINVSKFSQLSSLLSANDYGNSWQNMEVVNQQKTKIRTLDELLDEGLIPDRKRFLLKMDTQGYDLEVYKGASVMLENVCCMLSELSLIPIYHGMPHYLSALSEYEKQGFSVSGFYPITRDQNLALNEVDCMLVNVKSLVKL